MGITTGEVSGAFARYLLTWIDRWQKDGFEPVRTGWTAHARVQDKEIVLPVGGSNVAGRFFGLSEAGDVLLQTAEGKQAVAAVDLIEEVDGANA
jgi:biotin-(acetyl-CoA carboxylase) ligase